MTIGQVLEQSGIEGLSSNLIMLPKEKDQKYQNTTHLTLSQRVLYELIHAGIFSAEEVILA